MTLLHSEAVTAPFEWEPYPATGFDSAPAVFYRIGSPLDPFDATRLLAASEEEALTSRWIPRLEAARRRYAAVTAVEEPRDLRHPPYLRPALVQALAYARACTGGILFEDFADLGSPLEQAIVLSVGLTWAGLPDLRAFDNAMNAPLPVGTLTVNYLGTSKGRREALRSEHSTLARHGTILRARVTAAERYDKHAIEDGAERLGQAVNEVRILDGGRVSWGEAARSSAVVGDLSPAGAATYLRHLSEQSVPEARMLQMLNLLGFLNLKGHRAWYRAELRSLRDQNQGMV